MNQYLVDQIYDHHEWIRYISPRKLCYDYDIVEKYGLDDIIVWHSESSYKYSAKYNIVFNRGDEDDFLFVDKDYYYYYIYVCIFRI